MDTQDSYDEGIAFLTARPEKISTAWNVASLPAFAEWQRRLQAAYAEYLATQI